MAENLEKLAADLQDLREAVDTNFVLTSAYIVFLMQGGFAMLEAGSIRSKNVRNVLMKNMLDACTGTIAYWLFGYAFSYGPNSSWPGFIGSGNFATSGGFGEALSDPDSPRLHDFFFQWTFAATTATIVSGSVAERTSFYSYLAYSLVLTAFVYPVGAHWLWDGNGWLYNLYGSGRGAVDYAGCTAVHMVGGIAAFIGAAMVGPRIGRFDDNGKPVPMPGHSATLAVLGVSMLWFGWYGFNPGSIGALTDTRWAVAERAALNTTMAGAMGGIVTMVYYKWTEHIFDLAGLLNGILAGLVGICSTCAMVQPYIAVIVGGVASAVYLMSSKLVLRLRIDDPLDAFAVHTGPGIWGAIAAGLFNEQRFQVRAGYTGEYWGLFYGGGARLLGANVLAIVVYAAWTTVTILPLFAAMKALGILRISSEEELYGNDISKHGGPAYPVDAVTPLESDALYEKDSAKIADDVNPDDGNEAQEKV